MPSANPADVESIDAIINASYDVISGPAGKARDWDRERSLFLPCARLVPTSKAPGVAVRDPNDPLPVFDVEGFIKRVEPFFKETGFYEKEIARRTEQFGDIIHIWSTYESRHDPSEAEPFMRGINSIQLFHDGERWWILTIFWQQENPDCPLPTKYLRTEP